MKLQKLNNFCSFTLLRFFLVGGAGASFYFIGSYILTKLGLASWISSITVYTVLIPTVFFAQKNIVFKNREENYKVFLRYLSLQLISMSVSAIIPFFADEMLYPEHSFLTVIFIVTALNYFFQKHWIFKQKLLTKRGLCE